MIRIIFAAVVSFLPNFLVGRTLTTLETESIVSNTDSISKIEYLACVRFHQLVNQYRIKEKRDTLMWNEKFYLASRNHAQWMSATKLLSHEENRKNKFYTGRGFSDRVDFIYGNKNVLKYGGENILYNFSCKGYRAKDIAENIAKESFKQWKESTKHRKNMIDKNFNTEAVSFVIDRSGKVWAAQILGLITN